MILYNRILRIMLFGKLGRLMEKFKARRSAVSLYFVIGIWFGTPLLCLLFPISSAAGQTIKKLSQNTICHSEPFTSFKDKLREESLISVSQTLRFAQGDSFEIVS